ncbi:Protein of unknown function [Geodermatophilus dictyosporus]|uniref:DUF732 domain-containing protein n=1 Tax=Geodermatophilus dictyosporus TaxID=1523247 RepID=A0A1I5L9I8_9ACTN|nr:DUF732 domain-containing protein [Geodermatophilus dictyosporus]SFO93885.1 Protein of unknown function [Geodermatophilus dictyosporus]
MPGAHEVPRAAWTAGRRAVAVALLLVLGLLAWAVVELLRPDGAGGEPAATTTPSPAAGTTPPPPAPTTSPPTPPAMSDADLRAAFLALAARDRGHDRVVPVDALPAAAEQVCATVRADPTDATLEAAATSLQEGEFALDEAPSWEFLDLATTVYCPDQHPLVVQAIDLRLG